MSESKTDQQILDEFFGYLQKTVEMYERWIRETPSRIFINSAVMQQLSKLEGFYQRPEVRSTEVTAFAPMVRRFKVNDRVVLTIFDRPDEPFLRVE